MFLFVVSAILDYKCAFINVGTVVWAVTLLDIALIAIYNFRV